MRLAYVIPWFGPDLKGGAEQHAWQFATRLAARGHAIDVLTTCCRSYLDDWATNNLPAGEGTVANVTVRRFPVVARDRPAFEELNAQLLGVPRESLRPGVSPVARERAKTWTDENINSRELEAYLARAGDSYDAIIFIPYLYGPTLRGMRSAMPNAWMQPCLHDEAYAYLPDTVDAVHAARGLLFNSIGEQYLAARLYGPAIWSKGHVVGGGVEFAVLDAHRDALLPEILRGRKFVLSLGRREREKGVDFLVEAFHAARRIGAAGDMLLVLAGPGHRSYDAPGEGVADLGFVSEETRVALLNACAALAIPSPKESLSRVLYEAWYACKPVIVRGACEATRLPVEACGGGWIAETVQDWTHALSRIASASDAAELVETGNRGRSHALAMADWNLVLERFELIVGRGSHADAASTLRLHAVRERRMAIHQLAPNLVRGDAISNEMIAFRSALRHAGYRSEIITTFVDEALRNEAVRFAPGVIEPSDALIYHHSIGAEVTAAAAAHPGPKGLIYHNITPAEYFRPYRPEFARILRDGREDLWRLASAFAVSAGDSRYNADELSRYGFRSPTVMPLPVDASNWDQAPDAQWMQRLADGRRNVLFVGRLAPNKRQDRLVESFSYLRAMTDARLVIAGASTPGDPYSQRVQTTIRRLGLDDDVIVTGHCSIADLHAFFRSADVFWSFSEHEGFCVPLVEAMWFDVPIVALSAAAVPETLGGAGMRFSWTEREADVAAKVLAVLEDNALRADIITRQRVRRQAFTQVATIPSLTRFVDRMLETAVSRGSIAVA